MKYCAFCGVAVKPIERGEVKHIGRGELPSYVHVRKRSEKDPIQCERSNLWERDVTEENSWNWSDGD